MIHESQVPRSCDRCYAVKERCQWVADAVQCERCTRVGHMCESKRPIKRPGRPPAPYLQSSVKRAKIVTQIDTIDGTPTELIKDIISSPLTSAIVDASIWKTVLSTVEYLSHRDLALLDRAVNQDDFTQKFVIGPSFYQAHRQKLVFHLLSSRQIVLDGYLAFALSCGDKIQVKDSYKRAASAVLTLRSFQVKSRLDITSCLILGWHILHFVFKVGGGELLEICNQTLSLIKPHDISEKYFETAYFTFLTSLVFTETAECLLKTKLPTLRVDYPAGSNQINGCVGLCTSLLPDLYDLALINVEMQNRSQQKQDWVVADSSDLQAKLEDMRLKFRDWKPHVPEDFCTKFTALEVSHMLCQTQVTQTAALLIIHRLQHPFGTEDGTASAFASIILSQIDMTVHITGKTPKCVDLSLIVACLEVEDETERAQRLRSFSAIGSYSDVFQDRIKSLMAQVWAARRRRPTVYWYHLGDILSPFS
ncbi:fatty-acid amide hydrolase [Metarhizium guizhouense ARSEF 977]|uniref:Fatty-acid amide hydrolase n=1 Tax=Metarhizium guizhouense (strain ARSEF 977) TaxID=1276136 RepID=A0A0B4GFG1_METGA|nr:fatty-acid amide hydrolase [Metarhizium guizhouense ARSEF 977]